MGDVDGLGAGALVEGRTREGIGGEGQMLVVFGAGGTNEGVGRAAVRGAVVEIARKDDDGESLCRLEGVVGTEDEHRGTDEAVRAVLIHIVREPRLDEFGLRFGGDDGGGPHPSAPLAVAQELEEGDCERGDVERHVGGIAHGGEEVLEELLGGDVAIGREGVYAVGKEERRELLRNAARLDHVVRIHLF